MTILERWLKNIISLVASINFLGSMRTKLLFSVSAVVVINGVLISILVIDRYRESLQAAMLAQVENIAHNIALQSVEKILINDILTLQKTLENYKSSHDNISYIFIINKSKVLAHTFLNNVPSELIPVNQIQQNSSFRVVNIKSTDGKEYLDIAWPIFNGKTGLLRVGLSKKQYALKIANIRNQLIGVTAGILLISIIASLLFLRRIIRPLTELTDIVQKIDKGEYGVRSTAGGHDEVKKLSTSFNNMVTRMEQYTLKLEEQTDELERAYNHTRMFCEIVQEIGAMKDLKQIGAYLMAKFIDILKCDHLALLLFNKKHRLLFIISLRDFVILREDEIDNDLLILVQSTLKISILNKIPQRMPVIGEGFKKASRYVMIPVCHENENLGTMLTACPGACSCKPEERESVSMILNQAVGVLKRALSREIDLYELSKGLDAVSEFNGIVGKDTKMQIIYRLINEVAPTDATVLIQGESGTGKEMVAAAIHILSSRSEKPFIVINCSAYPETMLESELFGHEKGAFTGATRQKPGRFEQANGGTVFLDEIGEISPTAQIKLLRVLQTRKIERLGGEKTIEVDVRILAATNKDLIKEVKEGCFREDLFYRLNVIPIHIPELKQRKNDIPLLSGYFLKRFSLEQGKEIKEISPEAMKLLFSYHWPGNVRELENTIEHAVVLSHGKRIEPSDLPNTIIETDVISSPLLKKSATMEEHERYFLLKTLEECGWNKKEAARRLGISRNTLYGKINKYSISKPVTH